MISSISSRYCLRSSRSAARFNDGGSSKVSIYKAISKRFARMKLTSSATSFAGGRIQGGASTAETVQRVTRGMSKMTVKDDGDSLDKASMLSSASKRKRGSSSPGTCTASRTPSPERRRIITPKRISQRLAESESDSDSESFASTIFSDAHSRFSTPELEDFNDDHEVDHVATSVKKLKLDHGHDIDDPAVSLMQLKLDDENIPVDMRMPSRVRHQVAELPKHIAPPRTNDLEFLPVDADSLPVGTSIYYFAAPPIEFQPWIEGGHGYFCMLPCTLENGNELKDPVLYATGEAVDDLAWVEVTGMTGN